MWWWGAGSLVGESERRGFRGVCWGDYECVPGLGRRCGVFGRRKTKVLLQGVPLGSMREAWISAGSPEEEEEEDEDEGGMMMRGEGRVRVG